VSILWTAMCFASAEELRLMEDGEDLLTLEQVTETFARDLTERGERFGLPGDPATDPEWVRTLEREYPLPSFVAP
jgi:hypothetical protein